jgi:hypothetical protein
MRPIWRARSTTALALSRRRRPTATSRAPYRRIARVVSSGEPALTELVAA